jgi:hypothetical protein
MDRHEEMVTEPFEVRGLTPMRRILLKNENREKRDKTDHDPKPKPLQTSVRMF